MDERDLASKPRQELSDSELLEFCYAAFRILKRQVRELRAGFDPAKLRELYREIESLPDRK